MPTAVALGQLVDLALGSPEVGAVNFNVLHTLLHAMLQKLNIQEVKADIDEHDRELLSTHIGPRAYSAFSVISADSGKGEDSFSMSEDNLSEKSSYTTPKRSAYHKLEKQVAELTRQMDELNKLPSNELLMNRTQGKDTERPVTDMWQIMQLKKRVDANEEGVGKLMSLFEDLMKELKDLKDAQADIMNKLNGIDLDAINKRLNSLDELCKDLQDKYSTLNDKLSGVASLDDLELLTSQFVTWPGLEDALKGVRADFESLQPISEERVVIELGIQTDTVETKSRPTSARPISRASSARSRGSTAGPSSELLELLERLGRLSEAHEALEKRVAELERLIQEKANKSDLQGLGGAVDVPEDLLNTLKTIQDELKALKEGQLRDCGSLDKANLLHVASVDSDKPLSVYEHVNSAPDQLRQVTPPPDFHSPALNTLQRESLPPQIPISTENNVQFQEFLSSIAGPAALNSGSISPEDLVCQPYPSPSPPPCLSTLPSSHSSGAISPVTPPLPNLVPRLLPPIASNGTTKVPLENPFPAPETSPRLSEAGLQLPGSQASFSPPPIRIEPSTDEGAIRRLQEAIQKLQADIDKMKESMEAVIEENAQRVKEIQDLIQYCDNLEKKKADKEYVDTEVDVKADRRQLEGKVNHSLFDSTTNELNRMIRDILDKLNGQDGDWKSALAKAMEELDGKLDRREMNNLREWLEKQLKALNNKIKSMGPGFSLDEEAAGMKKQLIQHFNCLSCDKPLDVMPHPPIASIPATYGLPKSRSPRPYTTFELDQIRQHARRIYNGLEKPGGVRYDDIFLPNTPDLRQKRLAAIKAEKPSPDLGVNPEMVDYYATIRQCGGSHTLTHPQKRITRLNNLGQILREDEQVLPLYKEEVDVQGADGHIYKGRMETTRLEAKLPSMLSAQPPQPVYMEQRQQVQSPPPSQRLLAARVPRPTSGRPTSSQSGRSGQRFQSAPMTNGRSNENVSAPENSQMEGSRTTTPQQDAASAIEMVQEENMAGEQEDMVDRQAQSPEQQEQQAEEPVERPKSVDAQNSTEDKD